MHPSRPPIGRTVAAVSKIIGRAFDDALTEAGGTLPTWLIMISMKTRALGNQRELAEAVGIQGATLTHHLNAMERDGLVTRVRDPQNRRSHVVELTKEGEELFGRLAGAAMAFDQRLRAGIDDDEIRTLEVLLNRLSANVTGP